MSGIVCILNLDCHPVDMPLLKRLTSYLTFRGPDGQSTWHAGPVGLGQALWRVSTGGQQEPLPCTLDGRTWIVADARIDGRSELVRKLAPTGSPVTNETSDAALILLAYEKWGEACLQHLIGDFVFILWDDSRQCLFCAHDHFGVRPLYYATSGRTLVLSNTLDCVRLHPGVPDTLNEQTIGDFLLFHLNLDMAETTFAAVHRLPPTHSLTVTEGQIEVRQYWVPQIPSDYLHYSRTEQYVEEFRHLLDEAIADRLRSDRICVTLSGGMDSTSITASAWRLLSASGNPYTLDAFTVIYESLMNEEEGDLARDVAEPLGIPLHLIPAERYLMQPPPEHPAFVPPEPSVIPECLPEYEMGIEVARRGGILLTGFGADPLFSAAPPLWAERWKRGERLAALRDVWTYTQRQRRLPPLGIARRLLQRRAAPARTVPEWIDPAFARRAKLSERLNYFSLGQAPTRSPLGLVRAPLWPHIFAMADPGASPVRNNVRHPFFDLRLLDFILATPPPLIRRKYLLRRSMEGRLPASILQRPKTVLGQRTFQLARQAEVQRARHLLVAQASDLGAFVDLSRASAAILEPTGSSVRSLEALAALAFWLYHQQPLHLPESAG